MAGGLLFIAVLWLSAYWEPDIRWLHFLQAWMYAAAIVLALRGNRWGYFIGISAAAFWNYVTLFVNTFLASGLRSLEMSIRSGEWKHVEQMVSVPGWIGNLVLIVGCVWAYGRLHDKRFADGPRFLAAFALTTGFFAAAIAISQPRYLPLFARALKPHWPW